MSSNTQDNTRNIYDTDTAPTSGLSSQNPPSSGLGIRDTTGPGDYSTGQSNVLGTSTTEQHGIESRTGIHSLDSGVDTGRTGYGSSPINLTSQQQYGQGMTTSQYDPSRVGEEGMISGSGQQQYGHGQGITGTGVGHHKVHHEGHLHGHGSSEAAKANCESCIRDQAAGRTHISQDTSNLGYSGSATGTNNQYVTDTAGYHGTTTGHPHGVTDTGAKPGTMDKIVGGAEKVAGKIMSNTEMYQRGEARAAGETPTSKN